MEAAGPCWCCESLLLLRMSIMMMMMIVLGNEFVIVHLEHQVPCLTSSCVCGSHCRACGPAVTWGAGIICVSVQKASIFSLHLRPGRAVPYGGAQPCRTVPGASTGRLHSLPHPSTLGEGNPAVLSSIRRGRAAGVAGRGLQGKCCGAEAYS